MADSKSPASTTAGPDTPAPGRLASIKNQLGAVDDLIMSTVLKSASFGGAGAGAGGAPGKEPLSLQQTSTNFRRFVQKSGPIFVAQDAVEAVLFWEDHAKTAFFGALWAFLCWYPLLLLVVPHVVLLSVLLYTYPHHQQGAGGTPDSPSSPNPSTAGPNATMPPAEGSVDYLANLHGIQIMMGRLSTLSDYGRSLLPYLTWRSPYSLLLLQLTLLSGVATFLLAPLIPWRLVAILLGEGLLVAGHPLARDVWTHGSGPAYESARDKVRRWRVKLNRLVEDDALGEDELEGLIVEVERLEVESRLPGDGGGWVGDVVLGGQLPEGARWLKGSEWRVDELYAGGRVDEAGFLYLHLDGRTGPSVLPAAPAVVVGEGGAVLGAGAKSGPPAQARRRRLVRRAVKYTSV